MKKAIKIFLVILLILIVTYIGIVIYTNNNYLETKKIEENGYEYVYKYNRYTVTINKYKVNHMQCIKAPCPGESKVLIAIYTIPLTKKYKDIKNISDEPYELLETEEYSNVKKQGYIYDKKNNTVSIYLGEKPSGGYRIGIVHFEYDIVPNAIIDIEEDENDEGVATMALTSPMIKIKLNKKVKEVHIFNLTTNKDLSDLSE